MDVAMPQKIDLDKRIDFFRLLESGEVITQSAISDKLSVSIGLVNALLKRAVHKGYVKVKAAPYKRFAYYLTAKGFQEKSRLISEYLQSSLSFFKLAKAEYTTLFIHYKSVGIVNFIFVGAGELAEIALLSSIEAKVNIIGIIDDQDHDKVHGLDVLTDVSKVEEEYRLVLTIFDDTQNFYDEFVKKHSKERVIFPSFLNISTDINFKAPDVKRLSAYKKVKK